MRVKSADRWDWRLFGAVWLCEVALLVGLWLARRIPAGHDGFQYFDVSYFFLNQTATGSAPAHWTPYLTQGVPVVIWWNLQATVVNVILELLPFLNRFQSFLTPFYASILFNTFILALGTWLLSSRLFQHARTGALATLSLVGSAVWFSQMWWNFHFYYALPIILYLLLDFLERGRLWPVIVAAFLLASQNFGNLQYFLPVTALFLFLYCFGGLVTFPRQLLPGLEAAGKRKLVFMLVVLACAAFFVVPYLLSRFPEAGLYHLERGRNKDQTVPLDIFLTWASNTDLTKWTEVLLGTSPSLDYTVYIGYLPLIAGIAGLFRRSGWRRKGYFLAIVVFLQLLSSATFLSRLLYHVWPFMKYFRHLGLVAPLVKVALCLYCACCFDQLLSDLESREPEVTLPGLRKGVVFLLVAAVTLGFLLTDHGLAASYVQALVEPPLLTVSMDQLTAELLRSLIYLLLFCASILLLIFRIRRQLPTRPIITAMLLLAATDIYSYRCLEALKRTVPLNGAREKLARFTPMPFVEWRSSDLEKNPRVRVWGKPTTPWGSKYWSESLFWLQEQTDVYAKTEWWAPAVEDLAVLLPHSSDDLQPRLLFSGTDEIPVGIRKLSGVLEPRIQFFRKAYVSQSKGEIARVLATNGFSGDVLLVTGNPGTIGAGEAVAALPASADALLPPGNDRVAVRYHVSSFDANGIGLEVENPASTPIWVFYSDGWDPHWRGFLDGKEAAIFPAALAYKAMLVPPGKHQVTMTFRLPVFDWFQRYGLLNAFLTLTVIGWLAFEAGRASRPGTRRAPLGCS